MGIPVKVLPENDPRRTQSAAEGGKGGKEGLVLLCGSLSDQSELRDSPSEDDLVNEGAETFALVGFREVGFNKLHQSAPVTINLGQKDLQLSRNLLLTLVALLQ